MSAVEIPLTPDNQQFNIQLNGSTTTIRLIWRDVAGWIMDVSSADGEAILSGVPLVVGVDLLEQYPQLGIDGKIVVLSDDDALEYPTKTNLGLMSHVYFIQE